MIKPAGKVDTKARPTVEVPDCTPPTTLVVGDLKQGSGATAKAGEEVKVQYVGVTSRPAKNSTPPGTGTNPSSSNSAPAW